MKRDKSENVLEQKRKNRQADAEILHKKETVVYNKCFKFRSRAIKNEDSKKSSVIGL